MGKAVCEGEEILSVVELLRRAVCGMSAGRILLKKESAVYGRRRMLSVRKENTVCGRRRKLSVKGRDSRL